MITNSETLVTLCERTAERLRLVHEAVLETANSAPHMPEDCSLASAALVFGMLDGKPTITSVRATVDMDDERFALMLEDLARGIRRDGMDILVTTSGVSDGHAQA